MKGETASYNSFDWGIVKQTETNRSIGYKVLQEIGLRTPKLYTMSAKQILLTNEKYMEEIISHAPFLVICETIQAQGKKIGCSDVHEISKLYEVAKESCRYYGGDAVISILQQIRKIQSSFVATALSDGEGKLFIEVLNGTVDTRDLTSRGADASKIKKNIFWDEENFEIADFDIFPKILEIYKGCRWKRGYYEITYGAINSNTNMFYTYYSSKESYINLLSSLTYDFHHIMQSKIFAINNLLYPL